MVFAEGFRDQPCKNPGKNKMALTTRLVRLVFTVSLLLVACSCTFVVPPPTDTPTALKLGLLLNYTGSPEASADRERAFNLAISHVNAGGGVLGQPVTGITADATSDPQAAWMPPGNLIEVGGRPCHRGRTPVSARCESRKPWPAGRHSGDPSLRHLAPTLAVSRQRFPLRIRSPTHPVGRSWRGDAGSGVRQFGLNYPKMPRAGRLRLCRAWGRTLRSVALEVNHRPICRHCGRVRSGAQAWWYSHEERLALSASLGRLFDNSFWRAASACVWCRRWGNPLGRHVWHCGASAPDNDASCSGSASLSVRGSASWPCQRN